MGKFRTLITNSAGVLPILSTGTSTAQGSIYLDGNDDAVIAPPNAKALLISTSGVLRFTFDPSNPYIRGSGSDIRLIGVDAGARTLLLAPDTNAANASYLQLQSDTTNGGNIFLLTGISGSASVNLGTRSASGSINFQVNSTNKWRINSSAQLTPVNNNDVTLGTSAIHLQNLFTYSLGSGDNTSVNFISNNTTRWILQSGGGLVPAIGGTYNFGSASLPVYTVHANRLFPNTGGELDVGTQNASGSLFFTANAVRRWNLQPSGHLIPVVADAYNLGDPTYPVKEGYFGKSSTEGLKFSWNTTESAAVINTLGSTELQFHTVGSARWRMLTSGHLAPYSDNTYDIGTNVLRVRNIYLSGSVIGLDTKDSVKVATTANIATLSGLLTVDGVTLVAGDRVLVKNQSTASQNGIYVAASGAWSRSPDANTSEQVTANMFVFVEEGSTLADTQWILTSNNPITLGTTALVFTQFGGAAGSGLVNLNGLITVSQSFATGSTGTDFNINSTGSTHTFNIPDASATNRGLITVGAQTIAGAKTFTGVTQHNANIIFDAAATREIGSGSTVLGALYTHTVRSANTDDIRFRAPSGQALIFGSTAPVDRWYMPTASSTLSYVTSPGLIRAQTNDGSDTFALDLAGGGLALASRGGQINLYGNEHATLGGINIQTGDAAGGNISLIVNNGTGIVRHRFNGVDRWTWNDAGNQIYGATDAVIRADTVDTTDNKSISLCGGGGTVSTRGGTVIVYGNEYGSVGGRVLLDGGFVSTGVIRIQNNHPSADIQLKSGTGVNFFNSSNNPTWSFYDNGTISQNASNGSDFIFSRSVGIIRQANDTQRMVIAGGSGGADAATGAYLDFHGNGHASFPGLAVIRSGNAGYIQLVTGTNINGITFNANGTTILSARAAGTDPIPWVFSVSGTPTADGQSFQFNVTNPNIAANVTRYYKGLEVNNFSAPIAATFTDSGYRIGAAVQSFFNTAGFAGTLTQQYGIWSRVGLSTASPTGTITNSYGIYVETLNAGISGTITNAWGVYQASNGGGNTKNYFEGRVGIGGIDPTSDSMLDVNGLTQVRGNLRFTPTTFEIFANTSDGSDTKRLVLGGGGATSSTRGGYILINGNEETTFGGLGSIGIYSGTASAGVGINIQVTSTTGALTLGTNSTTRLTMESDGNIIHKTHANYSGSGMQTRTLVINTTNATATNIWDKGIADNTTVFVEVKLVGRFNSTTAKGVGGKLKFVVYRNNGGSAVIAADFGGRIKEIERYGTSGYDFDVVVSGNNFQIQVTGAASETVSWTAHAEFMAVSTSA